MTNFEKIELLYLKIFKIVVLVVLTLALVISLVMAVKGAIDYSATPRTPPPAESAPKPNVNIDDFIKQLEPEKEEPPPATKPKAEEPPRKNSVLDDMVDNHVLKLWTYFDGYQQSCNAPTKVDKETFLNGFPKGIMRGWFQSLGQEFAESQDRFVKSLLGNQKVIQYCREKSGKGQIFFRSLDWHKNQYEKQIRDGKLFERNEAKRIQDFEIAEENRVSAEKEKAIISLITALSAFGIFMCLALLLIFSKIETNLRGFSAHAKGNSSE